MQTIFIGSCNEPPPQKKETKLVWGSDRTRAAMNPVLLDSKTKMKQMNNYYTHRTVSKLIWKPAS